MPARSRIILPLAIPDKAGMVLAEMCPVQWANITLLSVRWLFVSTAFPNLIARDTLFIITA